MWGTNRRFKHSSTDSIRLAPGRMTTYPFERVWHHGRGINFAAASDRPLKASNIPRCLHVAAEQAGGSNNLPPVFGQDLETSDDDSASFTTAPEFEDDTGNAPSAVLEPETVPTIGIAFPKPPKTQLEYNVCEEAFSAARDAPLGSTSSYWSHKMYRGPLGDDGKPRNVTVHYCKSKHTMERTCQYFKDEKVLGFDMEWFPNATKASGPRLNCSLLQLASPSRIALFHVSLFPDKDEDDLITPTFRRIMEDPEISKVGVNIKGDCTRMRTHLGLGTRGIFELSHMYRLVKFSSTGEFDLITKKLVPLAKQVEECLGLPLFKGYDVRGSNWSKSLNMRQADCKFGKPQRLARCLTIYLRLRGRCLCRIATVLRSR